MTDIIKHQLKWLLLFLFFILYFLFFFLTNCLLWCHLQLFFDQIFNISDRLSLLFTGRCGQIHLDIQKISLNRIRGLFFKILCDLLFFLCLFKCDSLLWSQCISNRSLFLDLFHESLLLSLSMFVIFVGTCEIFGNTIEARTDIHMIDY